MRHRSCNPRFPAQLAQGRDGNLYGMMPKGGMFNLGTFFKVTPNGTVSVPYMFDGNDGNGLTPRSGLTLGTDGWFYGTTLNGGQSAGTIFKINLSGTIDTLHSFTGQEGTTVRRAASLMAATLTLLRSRNDWLLLWNNLTRDLVPN
jgi:uncharacterized repeat protein (TIGR03803 family)